MIPRHSNPSALLNSTATVSRATLRDSDDEDEPARADPEHARMLARLEKILKRSIEDVLPPVPHVDGQRDGEGSRRRKRRKVDTDEVEQKGEQQREEQREGEEVVTTVPFRLLSGSVQPKAIVLVPKVKPKIVSEGPKLEDTEQEAKRRASRARAIAVDFAWVMDASRKLHIPPPGRPKEVVHLCTAVRNVDAPLLLLEKTKPSPPEPPRVARLKPEVQVELSPHAHETSESCCPIMEVKPETGKVEKRKRRRGKSRQKPPIQATFWRPPPRLGGKALGYAWGYEGSHPLQPGESPHYTRDAMKKAVYEEA